MTSPRIYSVVAIVGLLGASALAWWLQKPGTPTESAAPSAQSAGQGGGARPAGVELGQVKVQALRDDAQAVGTLRSSQNIMLRPEVAGRVLALGFADGARVRAGQVLVQLDDALQRAELQQALAQASVARANHQRNQELVAQNFIAQRALDESAAALQVSQAQLGLSCARLERMRLVAPFNGVVGIRNVNVGDYVKDGADLVNLENISSLYVDYRLPERFQSKVKPGQSIEIKLDAFANRAFKAEVVAIDPLIDANGRSIGVRAVLANTAGEPANMGDKTANSAKSSQPAAQSKTGAQSAPATAAPAAQSAQLPSPQSLGCPPSAFQSARSVAAQGQPNGPLRPGMFARVTAVFALKPNALVVPEEAIVPQGGKQFVIKAVSPADLAAAQAAATGGNIAASTAASGAASSPNAGAVAATAPASAASGAAEAPALVSQRVEVKLGIRRGGQVEITEGLAQGDTIVVAGQQRLQKDGTALRVVTLGRGPANAANAASAAGASNPASGASGTSGVSPATASPTATNASSSR